MHTADRGACGKRRKSLEMKYSNLFRCIYAYVYIPCLHMFKCRHNSPLNVKTNSRSSNTRSGYLLAS